MDPPALAAVERVILQSESRDHRYTQHPFNVHRWIVAWQSESDAAINLRRHLNIRNIMPIPPQQDDESIQMDTFAPITILGQNRADDNKIVLFEHTGKIDVNGIVANVRLNPFMRNKFRMMEELQQEVVKQEIRSGRQSGGLLVMDLEGISFSPSLLSVIAGPYRVMWGTLFEQYPQLIQQILIVNAPTFVNLLYQTCQPFIPADYKKKIIISCTADILKDYIDPECLPSGYGGKLAKIPYPLAPIPAADPIYCTLNTISIPAGGHVVEKFQWKSGQALEFFMQIDENITYWIFYSEIDTKDQSDWLEIYPGCERPALKQIDQWNWTAPKDGFYYIRYGNERAWLFATAIHTAIVDSETRTRLSPIETYKP